MWIFRSENVDGTIFMKLVNDIWLKREYHCHLVENAGGRAALFDIIEVSMAD